MRQFYHYWTMPQLFLCLFVHVLIYSCVQVYVCDLHLCGHIGCITVDYVTYLLCNLVSFHLAI